MATSHGGDFVPTGPTHGQAYEPDKFAVKTILVVPGAVIVTLVVVFIVTDLIFGNIFGPGAQKQTPVVPGGAELNKAPLNDRLARISSSEPGAEYAEPRLEGLQRKQVYAKDGKYKPDGTPENTDPSNLITGEMITTQPTPAGNSPRYHADDLRPGNVPAVARPSTPGAIPVDKAIELAGDPKNATWAKALPAAPGAQPLPADGDSWNRPKESNGGNARHPAPQPPKGNAPAPKGGNTEKEPDKKEPEAKKEEPKKQ